jgi:hypothetical protein
MSDFTKSRISGTDSWATPKELYDDLDAEFHFTDGLSRDWGGGSLHESAVLQTSAVVSKGIRRIEERENSCRVAQGRHFDKMVSRLGIALRGVAIC